jgi:serine/threonine-protein kinase
MAENITGKLFADKYRVGSLLHASELGNFYRCRHAFTERPVILQVLRRELAADERASARFTDVAKAASHISSPNILAVTDFGKSPDGYVYAAFENIDGETLAEALQRDGQVPVAVALDVARQIAAGLASAHDAGLVHGNLSTGNILVLYAPDGTRIVKLFDFGSASAAAQPDGRSARDVAYIAPELFSPRTRPDTLSDIYSLGAVMYEMLAGDIPFVGDSAEDAIKKHIEEPPPPLSSFRSDLPPGVESIVLKALSKNPEMRYQSAGELADAIELNAMNADNAAGVAATSAGDGNNIWKTAFVVLAGISLLSAFLIYGTASKQTNPTTVLQPDANGQPVQPINPATGAEEQNLALMPATGFDANANTTMGQPPGTLPGGDGYNPWAGGVAPPPGGPPQSYVAPGGQVYTIDPNTGSPFMPSDSGVVLVPVPMNTNTAKPTPTPKGSAANANTQAAPPANTSPRSTPTPAVKPAATPAKTPAAKPPANAATKPE